jgi:hypothetical protein
MFLMHNIIKSMVAQRYNVELVGRFATTCVYTIGLPCETLEHPVLAAVLTVQLGDHFKLDVSQNGPTLEGTGFIEFKKALRSESLLCKFEKVDE